MPASQRNLCICSILPDGEWNFFSEKMFLLRHGRYPNICRGLFAQLKDNLKGRGHVNWDDHPDHFGSYSSGWFRRFWWRPVLRHRLLRRRRLGSRNRYSLDFNTYGQDLARHDVVARAECAGDHRPQSVTPKHLIHKDLKGSGTVPETLSDEPLRLTQGEPIRARHISLRLLCVSLCTPTQR